MLDLRDCSCTKIFRRNAGHGSALYMSAQIVNLVNDLLITGGEGLCPHIHPESHIRFDSWDNHAVEAKSGTLHYYPAAREWTSTRQSAGIVEASCEMFLESLGLLPPTLTPIIPASLSLRSMWRCRFDQIPLTTKPPRLLSGPYIHAIGDDGVSPG